MLQLVCALLPSDNDLCYCLQFEHLVWFHTWAPVVLGRQCRLKALNSLPGFSEWSFSSIRFITEALSRCGWLREQEGVGFSFWNEISYFPLCIYNCSFPHLSTLLLKHSIAAALVFTAAPSWNGACFILFVFLWQLDASSSYSPVNNMINGRWVTNGLQTSLAVSICNLSCVTFLTSLSSCDCQISCNVPLHSLLSDFTTIPIFWCFLSTLAACKFSN